MINVLHVVGEWGNGGIERNISNYSLYANEYNFKLSVFSFKLKPSTFSSLVLNNGGFITSTEYKVPVFKHFLRLIKIIEIVKRDHFKIIHLNFSFGIVFFYSFILKLSLKNTIIIVHGHGSNLESSFLNIRMFVHKISKYLFVNSIDTAISCSDKVTKWMFSNYKEIKNVEFLPSSINISEYEFIRSKENIKNIYTIGTIGRFEYQKNPFFIVNLVKILSKSNLSFKFIWVGQGSLYNKIMIKVKKMNLENYFEFINYSNDVRSILSELDLFILPSNFEGNPIVLLEAQANGLHSIVSSTITHDVQVNNLVEFIDTNDISLWVTNIIQNIEFYRKSHPLKVNIQDFTNKGVESKENAFKLFEIYISALKGVN